MKMMNEDGVSPVIGVMLMIVVTVIIAAVVSGLAGGYADDDRKAPTAIISCKATDSGLLFTHESGDYIDLADVVVVLTNGEDTKRFYGSANQLSGDPIIRKVSKTTTYPWTSGEMADLQINTGNQFFLYADNDGSGSGVDGAYLGWDSGFYLTTDEIGTYKIIERESSQIISEGVITI